MSGWRRLRVVLLGAAAWGVVGVAGAHAPVPPPHLQQRAGITQKLGAALPMAQSFRDADGRAVTLAGVSAGKPVLLSLGYYRCPNLCDVVLDGMAHAMSTLKLRPGQDFQVVFLSIDPHETAADAAHSQQMLAQQYPAAAVGHWHFLTGDAAAIHAVAQAIGFRYFLDTRNQQYAHAAGLVAITAAGKVAQYFFGVSYPPTSLRLALVDASAGTLGTVIDRLVLLCCGYDATTGRYNVLIGRVMRGLGLGFALGLGLWLVWMRRRART